MQSFKDEYLYPYIIPLINAENPVEFLDYGCGNGFVATLLDNKTRKYLYDANPASIQIELEKFNARVVSRPGLRQNFYDTVLLSYVLICIQDETMFTEVIADIANAIKPGGVLIIAECHPCFRGQKFSYMKSDFDASYFDEGAAEHKTLFDKDGGTVNFDDYHHSMSFILNHLADVGFALEKMIETKDTCNVKGRVNNIKYPNSMILKLRKVG
jgi:SAM-dependent methyltransferase